MKSNATKIWINHDHLTGRFEVYDGIMLLMAYDTRADAEKYIEYLKRLEELHAQKENSQRASPEVVSPSEQTDRSTGNAPTNFKNETNQ